MPSSARTPSLRRAAAFARIAVSALCYGGLVWLSGCEKAPAPAPGFALKDLSGKTVRLADLRGKVVLLDFWATWCGPCQESIPYYEKIYERHQDQGLAMVGINEDGLERLAAEYAAKNRMTYPILLDEDNQAFDGYGVRALPSTFLIDREGRLLDSWVGFGEDVAVDMEREIEALLSAKQP